LHTKWQALIVALISLPIAWLLLVDSAIDAEPAWPGLQAFYVIGVFVGLMLLGGPHGAPRWGIEGATFLGVTAQNLLIWWLARSCAKLWVRARELSGRGHR
jgi:hypothetical protein